MDSLASATKAQGTPSHVCPTGSTGTACGCFDRGLSWLLVIPRVEHLPVVEGLALLVKTGHKAPPASVDVLSVHYLGAVAKHTSARWSLLCPRAACCAAVRDSLHHHHFRLLVFVQPYDWKPSSGC